MKFSYLVINFEVKGTTRSESHNRLNLIDVCSNTASLALSYVRTFHSSPVFNAAADIFDEPMMTELKF